MPQLYPMNWNFLCLLFIMIIIFSIVLVYFNKSSKMKAAFFLKKSFQKNWKW
uniref:ATP synthase F0 subunit 8 n=1 Tax=Ornithodoros waterbergensis TaxID=1580575 RepID=A0A1P8AGB4_9ACAR|nr:ATP synthase F0 subunit 8 [Ornithodoros waterbergensis]AMX74158.1 ATP synthase F0 subunit 8 [Ornithodoros waterbergensis]UYL27161.1 ATP synthase F0 subunit 8 [Ornithodoros waterbergensis]